MTCPLCGHDNIPDMKFCGECGTRLVVVCAECSGRNAPSQKFCGQCGARLPVASSTAIRPAPQDYTPRHLAERILSSKAALEGERKQVTVLFADLKGSMELLAARDPEEARKILDPVLEFMMEAALVAHCHLGLGMLYRRAGKREQAQKHLSVATTMYREMRMTYWLEQAEAEGVAG